jgi:hypothetical protein
MNRTGNVGAPDLRGLTFNTLLQVYPPCAMVQQASLGQSISNNTNTPVQFDTILFDTGGQGQFSGWNLATSSTTYTVPVSGLYLLSASVVFATSATGLREAWFEHNGSVVDLAAQSVAFSASPAGVFTAAHVQCTQGDTLQLYCFQDTGGALSLSNSTGGPVWSILWLGD